MYRGRIQLTELSARTNYIVRVSSENGYGLSNPSPQSYFYFGTKGAGIELKRIIRLAINEYYGHMKIHKILDSNIVISAFRGSYGWGFIVKTRERIHVSHPNHLYNFNVTIFPLISIGI